MAQITTVQQHILRCIGSSFVGLAMDWMFLSPQKSYVEALTPIVTVFWGWASQKVIKVNWDNKGAPWSVKQSAPWLFLTMCSLERRGKHVPRQPCASRGEMSHQNQSGWHPDLRLTASRTMRNRFLVLEPVCGILSLQPKKTNIGLFPQDTKFW